MVLPLRILSHSEQVVEYLRREVCRRRWSGTMPGVPTLAAELGINHKTVAAALEQLEEEGLLVPQGAGRPRLIVLPSESDAPASLRISILLFEAIDRRRDYMLELVYQLSEAGHVVTFSPKCMTSLGMEVRRIAAMVKRTEADAWVVQAGPRELLEWFSTEDKPVFALFGRAHELPVPSIGPDAPSACAAAVRALIDLGHRRIVSLDRRRRLFPTLGLTERAILDELAEHDIPCGDYNLPFWEMSVEGFHRCLNSLFSVTPPTAIILHEPAHFIATQQFLAKRGLQVPATVSLVCTTHGPDFDWCLPSISHIQCDLNLAVRRVVRWGGNVSRGKVDIRQSMTPAKFVRGGTIGPAPR